MGTAHQRVDLIEAKRQGEQVGGHRPSDATAPPRCQSFTTAENLKLNYSSFRNECIRIESSRTQLSLQKTTEDAEKPQTPQPQAIAGESYKIMIVDDEAVNHQVRRKTLPSVCWIRRFTMISLYS